MKDPVHELIDEAIAARNGAAVLSMRQQKELAITQGFDSAFAAELAAAYAAATPDERTRKLYSRLFEQFRDWLRPDQVSALPCASASAASFLIHLAINGTPLPRIKESASAITWFHDVHGSYLDGVYITAALTVAAKLLSPDDGGGQPLPSRTTITAADNVPLAASN